MIGVFCGISLETFASYAAMGGMFIFIPVLIASLVLPRRYPDMYRNSAFRLRGFWLHFCPIVGILMALFFCLVILADLGEPVKVIPFILFILSGVVYYEARKRYLFKKGLNIEEMIHNDERMQS